MDASARRPGEPLLLACDLDGTLLDYEAAPLPGAGEAVAELVAAGATFVVVTGRPLQSARRATSALGVEPVVFACYHGALIVEADGVLIRHLPVPRGPARAVAAEALAAGVGVTVWDVDEPRELDGGRRRRGRAGGRGQPARPPRRPGRRRAAARRPARRVGRTAADPADPARLPRRLRAGRRQGRGAAPRRPASGGADGAHRRLRRRDGGRIAARRGRRAHRRRRHAARARATARRAWSPAGRGCRTPSAPRSCRCSDAAAGTATRGRA